MTAEFLLSRVLRRQYFQVKEAFEVAYGGIEEEFPKEKDLIKAHLVVALLEQYKYPINAIQVNKFVGTAQGLRETDVLALNRAKEPFLLAVVEVPQLYEERVEAAMRDLYAQAAPQDQLKSVRWLLYYTRWYATKGVLQKKHITVDYLKFPTFDSWHTAGKPFISFMPSYL